jgi:hypothetical protein
MNGISAPECSAQGVDAGEITDRLNRLAARRGPTPPRQAGRGRDRLLQLADQAAAPTREQATALLHAVLSAVKRKAISESFATRLLDKMLPDAVAERAPPPAALALPEVTSAATFAEAQRVVLRAVAAGALTLAQGKMISNMLARTWAAVRFAQHHRERDPPSR